VCLGTERLLEGPKKVLEFSCKADRSWGILIEAGEVSHAKELG